MSMPECKEILGELIGRFERLNASHGTRTTFQCWSCAHAMWDDGKRALAALSEPDPRDALLVRLLDCHLRGYVPEEVWYELVRLTAPQAPDPLNPQAQSPSPSQAGPSGQPGPAPSEPADPPSA